MAKRGNGEGTIYQRNDGRWAAGISVEGGKRLTLYGKTRKEVFEKLKKAQHEQQQGTLVTGPQQTVRQYLEHWLEEVHRPTIRLASYVKYRGLLDRHILPVIGHVQIQKLTPQHVQALYAKKLKEGLTARSIHSMHSVLHRALDNAVRWGLISRNVCDVVTQPRPLRHEIQPLTQEQARQLLATAHEHRTRQLEARLKAGEAWQERDLVFCNTRGGFLDPTNMLRAFHKLLAAAGLPDVRFHDLRHSAATILLSLDAHPKVVQELLGHSQIAMTMDTYSHVLPTMQKGVMERLDGVFGEQV